MPILGDLTRGKNIGKRESESLYIWTACVTCGKERWVLKWRAPCRCCSCANSEAGRRRRGSLTSSWKGGRCKTKVGYFEIKVQPDDFFFPMANHRGYIMEHRLVMAKHLGRNLHPWELVHHKNGIKDDNRIENLQLVSDDRHKQITIMETSIRRLETKVEKQGKLIKLLQWQIKELSNCKSPAKE